MKLWPTFPLGLFSSSLPYLLVFDFSPAVSFPWYYHTMKLTRDVFESLLSSEGLEVSFSLYHECLHSIAFTHAKVLSLSRHRFIDPSSPGKQMGLYLFSFFLIGNRYSFSLCSYAFSAFTSSPSCTCLMPILSSWLILLIVC